MTRQLTLAEFAARCGFDVTYIAAECRAGRLPRVRDERWRRYVIDLDDAGVQKWLQNPKRGMVSRYRKALKERTK